MFLTSFLLSCQKNVQMIHIKGKNGVFVEKNKSFKPDSNGILHNYQVSLPEYASGYYFTDYRPWPDFDNRLYPWFFEDSLSSLFHEKGFRIPSIGKPERHGAMIIFQLKDGNFLSMYTLSSRV